MYLESTLQSISKTISLRENGMKQGNDIFEGVVRLFIAQMKKDPLFNELYDRVCYGGNFYNDLRVRKPSKFNVNILLRIPSHMSPALDINTNILRFVTCKILNKNVDTNKRLVEMLDGEGFIKPTSVRAWMENMTIKALNTMCPKEELKMASNTFMVKARKGGSTKTIFLQGSHVSMEIDFIPCFVFGENHWPKGTYRSNPVPNKPEFFLIPESPKDSDLLWLLSFGEQERELTNGKQFLKPALKLLKRLSDYQRHDTIAGYFIKTAFLWEVEAREDLFNSSLTCAFLAVLEKYTEWLEPGELPYFWNKEKNLLAGIHPSTLENYANRLKRIRAKLDNYTVNEYMGVPRGVSV